MCHEHHLLLCNFRGGEGAARAPCQGDRCRRSNTGWGLLYVHEHLEGLLGMLVQQRSQVRPGAAGVGPGRVFAQARPHP